MPKFLDSEGFKHFYEKVKENLGGSGENNFKVFLDHYYSGRSLSNTTWQNLFSGGSQYTQEEINKLFPTPETTSSVTSFYMMSCSSSSIPNTSPYLGNIESFPKIDIASVTYSDGLSRMFAGCNALKRIYIDWSTAPTVATVFDYCFRLCKNLLELPALPWERITSMNYVFYNAFTEINGIALPALNVPKVKNMNEAFKLSGITSVSDIFADNLKNIKGVFNSCPKLTTLRGTLYFPLSESSGGINTDIGMFGNCAALSIIDVKLNAAYAAYMFINCTGIDTAKVTISKCTTPTGMFQGAGHINEDGTGTIIDVTTEADATFTGSMADMFSAFKGTKVQSGTGLNTSKITNFSQLCYNATNLKEFPDLDLSGCTSTNYRWYEMFTGCNSLTTLTDNPMAPEGSRWQFKSRSYGVDFSACPLDRNSILKVFNGLVEASTSTSASSRTIKISSTTNGYLTDNDKAIATNKNWVITVV